MLVETASLLVVRLGGSYVALPADGVRGVLTQEEAGNEPAVTVAGTVYQPVDLAQRLSVAVNLSGLEMRTVLYSTGRSHGAICVEKLVGLTDVERKDCLPLPPQFQCTTASTACKFLSAFRIYCATSFSPNPHARMPPLS